MSRAGLQRRLLNWRWWVVLVPVTALFCIALPFLCLRRVSQALDWLCDVLFAVAERTDIAFGRLSHPLVTWAVRERPSRKAVGDD